MHKTRDEVVPVTLGRELFRQARAIVARAAKERGGEEAELEAEATSLVRFVEIDRDRVMKRHHVDAFASPEWLRAVASFFAAARGEHQRVAEGRRWKQWERRVQGGVVGGGGGNDGGDDDDDHDGEEEEEEEGEEEEERIREGLQKCLRDMEQQVAVAESPYRQKS